MRICKPSEMVGKTQYAGGSEITQVSAYDATDGNAVGADRTLFKQTLKVCWGDVFPFNPWSGWPFDWV